MSDPIDRQAAIDAIEQHKTAVLGEREWDKGIAYGYEAAHIHLVEIVRKLPSTERWGRWVKGDEMADYPRVPYKSWETYCSCCGAIKEQSNDGFCGNCGARMEASE